MLKALMKAEFFKMKRQWIWSLVVLGPAGILFLQSVYFMFRYDHISENYNGMLWEALSIYILDFSPAVIILGISIITSALANMEHSESVFKQLLSLPVDKWKVFLSKFLMAFILLLTSCAILSFGTIAVGLMLGFGSDIPFALITAISFFPYLSALPILALQICLAIMFNNQGIALSVGVFSAVIIMLSDNMPVWLPIVWPTLIGVNPAFALICGLLLGILLIAFATVDFVRRDV